jgi:hypothetical protein
MVETHSEIFEHLKKHIEIFKQSSSNTETIDKLNEVLKLVENCKTAFELELACARKNARNDFRWEVHNLIATLQD